MAQSKRSLLLDTSLLALRRDESSADRVEGLIAPSEKESMPAFGFFPEQGGEQKVKRRPVTPYDCWILSLFNGYLVNPVSLGIASRLKAGGSLSVADSWIGATAIAYGATKYWISVCSDSNSA